MTPLEAMARASFNAHDRDAYGFEWDDEGDVRDHVVARHMVQAKAALAAYEAAKWRPIEEAPKDGAPLLLLNRGGRCSNCCGILSK